MKNYSLIFVVHPSSGVLAMNIVGFDAENFMCKTFLGMSIFKNRLLVAEYTLKMADLNLRQISGMLRF
jgi:hypothetical protein